MAGSLNNSLMGNNFGGGIGMLGGTGSGASNAPKSAFSGIQKTVLNIIQVK
jgi:hypothetical protein